MARHDMFESLEAFLSAEAIGVLREAAANTDTWRDAMQKPRAYLRERGHEVPEDTHVALYEKATPPGLIRTGGQVSEPVVGDCPPGMRLFHRREVYYGCKKLVKVVKIVRDPRVEGGVVDRIEVWVCLEKGFIEVDEWFCGLDVLVIE